MTPNSTQRDPLERQGDHPKQRVHEREDASDDQKFDQEGRLIEPPGKDATAVHRRTPVLSGGRASIDIEDVSTSSAPYAALEGPWESVPTRAGTWDKVAHTDPWDDDDLGSVPRAVRPLEASRFSNFLAGRPVWLGGQSAKRRESPPPSPRLTKVRSSSSLPSRHAKARSSFSRESPLDLGQLKLPSFSAWVAPALGLSSTSRGPVQKRRKEKSRPTLRSKSIRSSADIQPSIPSPTKEEAASPVEAQVEDLDQEWDRLTSEFDAIVAASEAQPAAPETEARLMALSLEPVNYRASDEPLFMRGDRKVLTHNWVEYTVPQPRVVGCHSGYLGPQGEDFFTRAVDIFPHITVFLPKSLVDALCSWWVGKDANEANYLVSVQMCKNLMAKMDFKSSHTETRVCQYAPFVAMTINLKERSGVALMPRGRVVSPWKLKVGLGASFLTMLAGVPIATAAPVAAVVSGAAAVALPFVALAAGAAAVMALSVLSSNHVPLAGYAKCKSVTSYYKAPRLAKKSKMTVKPSEKPLDKESKPATATCIPFAGFEPTVFSSNQTNAVAALTKRFLAEPPGADPVFRAAFISSCYSRIRRWLGKPFALQIPRDVQGWKTHALNWVERSNSSDSVKERNRQAIHRLAEAGITCHSVISPGQIHEWTTREMSIKRETVLKDETGAPRQIMGATPEFCVLVNPFIADFTGLVKRRLQRRPTNARPVFYAPGASANDFAAMQEELLFKLPCGANVDQAKWDSSQQADCGKAELGLMKDFGCPNGSASLIQRNLEGIHGYSREGIVFKGPYMRQSGDGHTTVGNTMLAAAVGVEIVSQCLGREALLYDMFLGAGGDDGSLMTRVEHPEYEYIAARAGFPVTIQRVSDPALMEFLGCRLTRAMMPCPETKGQVVRRVYMNAAGRTIAKLAYSVRSDDKTSASIAKGAAQSFLGASSGNPPLASYVRRCIELAGDAHAKVPNAEPYKMSTTYTGSACAETWVDLELQYGWTQPIQEKWEEFLAGVYRLGEPVDCPMAALLIANDHGRDPIDPTKKAEVAEITYADWLARTTPPPPVDWALSSEERNAAQHAANGNGSLAATPVVVLGAHHAVNAAAAFGESIRRVVPMIRGASKSAGLTEGITEAATEAFVTAAWDHALAGGEKKEDMVLVSTGKQVFIELCGNTTVGIPLDDEDVVSFVHRVLSVPVAVLGKLAVFQMGKPATWTDKVTGEQITVRARLLGGASISRSERIINRITNAEGLQETSRGALMAVLDPFHDHDYRVVGLPDSMSSSSVVELYKQTFTLATNQGSTVNWDANVVLDPDVLTKVLATWTRAGYAVGAAGGLTNAYTSNMTPYGVSGGITAYTSIAGTPQNLQTINVALNRPTIPSIQVAGGIGPAVSRVPGSYRVFGLSMEIENSTAPLYQQGNVIVWRQPMPNPSDATVVTAVIPNGAVGNVSGLIVPDPPSTPAEAMLLAGSRQWHAKEGAMVIATPNSGEFPVLNSQCVASISYEDDPTGTNYSGPASQVAFTPAVQIFIATARTPFNQSGAFFTGLSPQTVLNINVRTWIEIFPSQLNNPLTPLSQPSAPYDEVFWRIYSECIKTMPPGVMLKENGLGDWLSDIAGKIGNFVSPIAKAVSSVASFIPHPAAQGIARVADMVGGVSERVGSAFGAPSSAQLRDDGVRQAISNEKAMMRSEARSSAPQRRMMVPKAPKPRRSTPIGSTALVKYKKR